MEQNKVLDIIINLVKGIKSDQELLSNYNGETLKLDQCGYLLSQILRHYHIKTSQSFVSEKAFALWSKISTDSIFNYTYRDRVKKNIDGTIFVDKYKGSEKVSYKKECPISFGETFVFNSVFIDEHIVPLNVIIKKLIELPSLDYTSVKSVLDKIAICKLLKEEDRNIKQKSNRSVNYKEVFYNDYLEAGIKIKDFNYNEGEIYIKNLQEEVYNKENKKNMNTTATTKTAIKRKYYEEFTINNIQKVFRGKKGFPAINSKGQEIGIVFMGDDKRRNYGNCELCMYEKYFDTYGQWHRFTVNGQKIKWEDLVQRLNIENSVKLFIE